MGGEAFITNTSVSAMPGGESSTEVRVRNTGSVVDQFSFEVLGDTAGWTTVEPSTLSLFPEAEGSVVVRFRPPLSSDVTAGAIPFAVRITAHEDREWGQVEEGTVSVGGVARVETKITPRTSQGRKGEHRVEIRNVGNATITADVSALDPDAVLTFNVKPAALEIPPGVSGTVHVDVRSRKGQGPRRPFEVTIDVAGQAPIKLDAAHESTGGGAGWVLWLALAAAAAGAGWWFFLRDDAGAATLVSGLALAASGWNRPDPG